MSEAEQTDPPEQPGLSVDDLVDDLDELCSARGYEYGIRLEIASQCAWSAEVRVTLEPNRHGMPDRSFVTFKGGGSTADDALLPALIEMIDWLPPLPKE